MKIKNMHNVEINLKKRDSCGLLSFCSFFSIKRFLVWFNFPNGVEMRLNTYTPNTKAA